MLQATVLGSGLSPGQALHARAHPRARNGRPAKQYVAQPLALDQPSSSSSAAYTPVTPYNAASASTSGTSSTSVQSSEFADETLTWSRNEVTWSRGAEVVRRFSFEESREEAEVMCAVFAWMPMVAAESALGSLTMPSSSTSASASSSSSMASASSAAPTTASEAASATFGPFHSSQQQVWGFANKRKAPLRTGGEKERAVVIFLKTVAQLYFASGENITVFLPFVTQAAWPLPSGGVIIQREISWSERHAAARGKGPRPSAIDRANMSVLEEMNTVPDPLPILYTLTERFGEIKPVMEGSLTGGVRDLHPTIVPGTLAAQFSATQSILYVSPDPYPLIVTYDRRDNRIIVFRHVYIRLPKDEDDEDDKPERTQLAHKRLLDTDDLRRHAGLTSSRRERERERERGVAPPAPSDPLERVRRKSRLSTASFLPPEDDFDAGQFALEGVSTAMGGARSRLSVGAADRVADRMGDRRASVAGNLSVAGGGRPSSGLSAQAEKRMSGWEFPKAALGILAEDLRDTTMMHGLVKERKRSEVVIERVFDWRCPGQSIDPNAIRVFLSENVSRDSVFLNIVLPSEGGPASLFTFHVEVVGTPVTKFVFNELRATRCAAAAPVISTRPDVLDTLVVIEDGPRLMTASGRLIPIDISPVLTADGRDEVARLASSMSLHGSKKITRNIVDLVDPCGSRVTAVYSDGERARVSLNFTLPKGLTRRAIEALSYALSPSEFEELLEAFLTGLQRLSTSQRLEPGMHWRVLLETLTTKCGLSPPVRLDARGEMMAAWSTQTDPVLRRLAKRVKPSRAAEGIQASVTPAPSAARVLFVLHFVAQDCRLACTTEQELSLIAPLIVSLASAVGRADWVDYWRRLMPSALARAPLTSPAGPVDTSILDAWDEPPDVLYFLERRMANHVKPFPSPQSLLPGRPSPLGRPTPCAQTQILAELYGRMRPSSAERAATRPVKVDKRAYSVVHHIVSTGLSHAWLADVPFGVSTPILEMVRACNMHSPKGMSEEFYVFIGRPDLAANCQLDNSTLDLPYSEDAPEDEVPTICQLLNTSSTKRAVNHSPLPHVRFGTDKRLEEVERIMQTTHVRTMVIEAPKGASEADAITYQQQVVATIAHRTCAITVGQGMFAFGSMTEPVGAVWNPPVIDLSVKVLPGSTVFSTPVPEGIEWPSFHGGVGSAVALSPECKGVTSSWIAYNRPNPLTPGHAGFLLGLGLQGHLRVLESGVAHAYLDLRHDMTTIGMLLGLGASFAGSQDPTLTRLISLHTVALLPRGSMWLGQHPTVQSISLVSLGLLYAGSRNLSMAETALREISRRDMEGCDSFVDYSEAYNFSSAAAFGLIMLGRGGVETSQVERNMLEQLTLCIHGNPPDIDRRRQRPEAVVDPTLTGPGAILALGLMFLKTNRANAAAILGIPQTPLELESVRPEHLLMRTFARALIMWDSVDGSPGWFEAQLPPFILETHGMGMELNSEVAYFNIIAGACLGLAFRFAGSANESIHNILSANFSMLAKAAAGQSMSYEGKIRRNAARQALNIVSLASAIEMAGTGELGLTRRLRMSHGQEGASINYGSHMAMHMALGILYLGRGYYTIGNSNLAIAALAIACFPRFLPAMGDNKAYPQALRHLWVMSAEPRCLIARDVDTCESLFLPVKLFSKDVAQGANLISPTLIAPMNTLKSIVVDSPRYLPVTFDFANARDWSTLVQTRTIWVKRRAGYIDYAADPRGYRSLMVRAGTMSGFDLHYDLVSPAAPITVPPSDVVELVTTHSTNPVCVAIAHHFSGDTWLEKFARNVLFECLSIDKIIVLGTYLSMALGLQADDELLLERISQAAFAHHFYSAHVWDKSFALTGGSKRHPVLRQTFLAALMRNLGAPADGADPPSRRGYFAGVAPLGDTALSAYLVRNLVPPVRVLELLRARVAEAGAEADAEALAFRCRIVAERYMAAVGKQYGEGGEVGLWKRESIADALAVWRGEA